MVLMLLRNGLSTSDNTEGTDTSVALRNCIRKEFDSNLNRATNYPQKSMIYKYLKQKNIMYSKPTNVIRFNVRGVS
jgi:hypothetical protein